MITHCMSDDEQLLWSQKDKKILSETDFNWIEKDLI